MTRLASQQASSFYFGGPGGPLDPEYSGSTMVFIQSTAPTGWTKLTDYDDHALRVVSGTASSGGSRPFSSTFTSYTYPGSSRAFPVSISFSPATISTAQMFPHSHPVSMYPSTQPTITMSGSPTAGPAKIVSNTNGATGLLSGGAGGSHTHTGMVGSTVTFDGTQPAININVKYVDAILATRD